MKFLKTIWTFLITAFDDLKKIFAGISTLSGPISQWISRLFSGNLMLPIWFPAPGFGLNPVLWTIRKTLTAQEKQWAFFWDLIYAGVIVGLVIQVL